MEIATLYEDDACLVVQKPAGVAVLDETESALPSMEQLLPRYTPVHRLDNDTTGCLLLAKDATALTSLREQFHTRRVGKIYLAIVHGLTPDRKTINTPIAHHPEKKNRMVVIESPVIDHRGKPQQAFTDITTLRHYFPSARHGAPYSLVRVNIATGVRHQIRVHLAFLGHPIVGDLRYAPASDVQPHRLHARQLLFRSPANDEARAIIAPLPESFFFSPLEAPDQID